MVDLNLFYFGRWDYRKSTKEIIESFLEEFEEDEPVDLVLSIDNRFAKDNLETTEKRLEHYNLSDPRLKVKHFPSREDYIQYLTKRSCIFIMCSFRGLEFTLNRSNGLWYTFYLF